METHPFAELFVEMSDDELRALAADIKANGLREPIVTFEGKLLDGRHRYRACQMVEVEPTFTDFSGTEAAAIAFVVSRNLMRRHLTPSQRAMIAARLANLGHGSDRKSDQAAPAPVDAPPITQAQAAAMMGVSERSVRDAVTIDRAAPELAEEVRAGRMAVKPAAAKARGPAKPKNKGTKQARFDAEKAIAKLSADAAELLNKDLRLTPAQRVHLRLVGESIVKRINELDQKAKPTAEVPA